MAIVSPTRRSAVAAAGLLATAAAGCGSVKEVDVSGGSATAKSGVAPPAGGTTQRDPLGEGAPRARRLTITVRDLGPGRFRYGAPATVRGGLVEIRLRNIGDTPHKAQLWRISAGHSIKEALRIRHPLPDWLRTAGGVSVTQGDATGTSLQSLPSGRYYVADTLGQPGTVAAFTVTAPQTSRPAPRAPARVEALDFSFRVSGLHAGRNSVDFDNTGAEQHHAFFVPMRRGADLAEVRRFFTEQSSIGPPPVDAEATRETVVLEGGERQITQLDLRAGRYALLCVVRGRAGGPQHVALGMINEVTVR